MLRRLAIVVLLSPAVACAVEVTGPQKTQQELMAERGYVRYRGAWRTVQEIELIERAERANLARIEWKSRLERLRRLASLRADADGKILSRRLVKSSGNPTWDQAVLRAIDRTGTLPRDTDGRVPSALIIGLRPQD